MTGLVTDPPPLLTKESREGFHHLLADIKGADTDRELTFYMTRFLEAKREIRMLFTMIEEAQLRKMREFNEEADRALAESQGGVRHIEPERGRA